MQIVGPNDKLKIHRDTGGGGGGGGGKGDEDIGSLVLMPPTIKREQKWLVVSAHCGEYLPVLDEAVSAGGITLSSSGLDA